MKDKKGRLLLHSCCAPCSSSVLEQLSNDYEITVFYYNPNIYPEEEYAKRVEEQRDFLKGTNFIEGSFDPDRFYAMAKGLEEEPEGGERCFRCYKLRLEETAKEAKRRGFDLFTTTLSVSPYKNAGKLNHMGKALSEKYGISYLYSDFKKKDGYKRSIELSREYGLYRQNYCGCIYSLHERLDKGNTYE